MNRDVDRDALRGLFTGLFDDASLYPPADTGLAEAVRAHARHRLAWYDELVGPFVCNLRRLPALAAEVDALGCDPVDVAVVVPDGIDDLADVAALLAASPALRPCAVEVPLKRHRPAEVIAALEPQRSAGLTCYVEIPASSVDEHDVHALRSAGLRLKLRTGGTSIDAFSSEAALAAPIVMCAAERLPFKCTAGLHHAVRHRDPETGFEHHGFLNVALAVRTATSTGSPSATAACLAERDATAVVRRVAELSAADVAAVRALFRSFGTCSVDDPVDDLLALGLVSGR
jgi:hypothetical protein